MLPWWGTILCSTLILRTIITLPLAIKQNKYLAKLELLKPMLKEITDAVKHNVIIRGQREGKEQPEIQKRNCQRGFYNLFYICQVIKES